MNIVWVVAAVIGAIALIALLVLAAKRAPRAAQPVAFDELFAFALRAKSVNLIVEAGKPPRIHAAGAWHEVPVSAMTADDLQRLRAMRVPGGGIGIENLCSAEVVRDEASLIELKLGPPPKTAPRA